MNRMKEEGRVEKKQKQRRVSRLEKCKGTVVSALRVANLQVQA